jgi:hypothetical protein
MSDFEINIEGDFLKAIRHMKKDMEKTAARILRKTANQTDKEIHRVVTAKELINIDFDDFTKRKKTRTIIRHSDLKGGIEDMNIVISITNKAHTSYRFLPTYRVIGRGKYWVGKIYGKSTAFYGGGAFVVPGKKPLFVRESTNRYPIKPVFGPSVPAMLEKAGLLPGVFAFTEMNLRANLLKGIGIDLDI